MECIVRLLQSAKWHQRTPELISIEKEPYFHMRATAGYAAEQSNPGKQKSTAIWLAEQIQ
jgi:hypothetical protein